MPRKYVHRQIQRLQRPGLSARQERIFKIASALVVMLFAVGWSFAVAGAAASDLRPGIAARITANPLSASAPPDAAFLLDAALRSMVTELDRGESGAVNVAIQEPGDSLAVPDSLPAGVEAVYQPDPASGTAPDPGIWNLVLRIGKATREVPGFRVLRPVPVGTSGSIGRYRIGTWPRESGAYAPPKGLIQVTPENRNLQVSEHFTLGDFLTKGQENVWPKYVAMSPRLLDKLELTIQALEANGHPVEDAGVISGFRTPYYNAHGGNTGGRGSLSRHMYGDAMDFFIDNDGDGRMDDLNGDGRVDIGDARVIAAAAEEVERRHPTLIGGIGVYRPTGAHSGFVHLDTRGFRARW